MLRLQNRLLRTVLSSPALRNSTSKVIRTAPIEKILIANRGEIACRVIRSAKKMGIKTVAIYSDADSRSMHAKLADEAYSIGGNTSHDSYLRMEKVLEIAEKSGAQAIHPGYGFLSENPKFVEQVEARGIVFLGPGAHSMYEMGDKLHSKRVAKNAKCFTIPGFDGEVINAQHAIELVKDIGYPVMIKASAGGGGKGMRVAWNDQELIDGYNLSKAESLSSFGDDTMLIERFIADPHHIEIQVIADAYGNVAALPERECSVQRRNQKVVEESPSCLIDPATRKAMQEQAIMLCKAVGYRSAGTIEMLADGNKNFYFLEMNTRLQVEHPISELVTGLDLVELMIRVGQGEKLPQWMIDNPHIPYKGWAIESRVYAEDPLRNFLPSIGPLNTYREPEKFVQDGNTIRIDTGVYEGGVISMYYDPMISKLCSHASDRKTAIALMSDAIDQYVVRGLSNNLCFLSSIMRNRSFREGNYGTKFIPLEYPQGFKGESLTDLETNELIAAGVALHGQRMSYKAPTKHQNQQPEGGHVAEDEYVVVLGGSHGRAYSVETANNDSGLEVSITPFDHPNATPKVIVLEHLTWQCETHLAQIRYRRLPGEAGETMQIRTSHSHSHDGVPCHEDHEHEHEHEPINDGRVPADEWVQYEGRSAEGYNLKYKGSQQELIVRSHKEHELYIHMKPKVVKDYSKFLRCPMPGTLISLNVVDGQAVEEGQILAVVEAMKMQNALRAPKHTVISKIRVKAGTALKLDEVIAEFAS